MGSKPYNNDFYNVYPTIKSSSSNNNDTSAANRGSYVENPLATCGKNDGKSGKSSENSGKHLLSWQAEKRADVLIARFNAPHCREFFLKCIYHLTDAEINQALECSARSYVKSPVKYFNKTCKQMLLKRGL